MKIADLKVGQALYDVHSERAGNTTMRREGCWECYVRAIDPDGKWVEISWNGLGPNSSDRIHSFGALLYSAGTVALVVAALLFGLAAYGTKYQVDTCEEMQCRPPLRGRLMRSTHYTNECVCVEVP